MNIIKANNYENMSNLAANILLEKIIKGQKLVLGLATGGTPVGLYNILIKQLSKDKLSLKHLHTVNLDEYIGIPIDHPQSYHQFMDENLFNHIDIPKSQTHLPNGEVSDLEKECERYEALIDELGGIDLQLLGVGSNGHIGFNEPGTSFESRTHVVKLAASTREANSRFFADEAEVPKESITMGIDTIMRSKEILLLASGKDKAEALYQLILGNEDKFCPVTVLKKHPNLTVIADKDALSLVDVKQKKYV